MITHRRRSSVESYVLTYVIRAAVILDNKLVGTKEELNDPLTCAIQEVHACSALVIRIGRSYNLLIHDLIVSEVGHGYLIYKLITFVDTLHQSGIGRQGINELEISLEHMLMISLANVNQSLFCIRQHKLIFMSLRSGGKLDNLATSIAILLFVAILLTCSGDHVLLVLHAVITDKVMSKCSSISGLNILITSIAMLTLCSLIGAVAFNQNDHIVHNAVSTEKVMSKLRDIFGLNVLITSIAMLTPRTLIGAIAFNQDFILVLNTVSTDKVMSERRH